MERCCIHATLMTADQPAESVAVAASRSVQVVILVTHFETIKATPIGPRGVGDPWVRAALA
jgi:hypothetical protein